MTCCYKSLNLKGHKTLYGNYNHVGVEGFPTLFTCFSFLWPHILTITPSIVGIYPLVAWEKDSQVTYTAEASTLTVGTCMDWLKNMKIIDDVQCSSDLAKSVPDTNGCYFVPAFSGLSVSMGLP